MSFEKINLPDVLLADLYKQCVVVIDNEISTNRQTHTLPPPEKTKREKQATVSDEKIPVTDNSKPLSYLGNNKKNISIIVKDEQAIHLQDELLDILSAILSACRLNLADVAIINMRSQQVNDTRLNNELQPASVLLFGTETSEIGLPFSIPDYKIQQFNNCAYLQASSLEKMKGASTEAKVEKSKLWVCLKTLFNV